MPPRDWVSITLAAVTLAVLGWLAVGSIDRWRSALDYPYQMDVSEGFILQQAVAIARGEPVYKSIDEPPFLVGNYPPLFQALYAAANGSKATLRSLPLGRAFTIGATLLSALLLGVIVCRMTGRGVPTALAPMLFLVTYEVNLWSAFVRVDFPALVFTLAGLLVFVSTTRRWSLVVSGLLFAAAFYTRQTAILAPIACTIALARYDWRKLPWFVGPAAIVGLLVLGWLQWATGGQFWIHTVTYNRNKMEWAIWLLLMKNEVWLFHRWLIVATIAATVAWWWPRTAAGQPRDRIALLAVGLYAIFATISLLSYAKVGAGVNYIVEPLAAAIIWLFVALGFLMNQNRRRIAIAICAVLMVHAGWLASKHRIMYSPPAPTPIDKALVDQLQQYVRRVNGDLLCEEPVLTMLAGRPVLFDSFIMSELAKEAQWDQTKFIHMIEKKQFARIVVNENLMVPQPAYERYTEAMATAVRAHYRFVNTVFYTGFPPGVVALPGMRQQYFIFEPLPENP